MRHTKHILNLYSILFISLLAFPFLFLSTKHSYAKEDGSCAAYFTNKIANPLSQRKIYFYDLGFKTPLVLSGIDARQELYFPVPRNIPLRDVFLELHADYKRAEGGRVTQLISIDGYPISARAFILEQGDAGKVIAIDGMPRENGFVRLDLAWSSRISDDYCLDERQIGNLMTVYPDSDFVYWYNPQSITTLTDAWNNLPTRINLYIPAQSVSSTTFDTTWRLAAFLESTGKNVTIRHLPGIGDTVDKNDFPQWLQVSGLFEAGTGGTTYRIQNEAQLGAAFACNNGRLFHPDLLIADEATLQTIKASLDALEKSIQTHFPEGLAPLRQWRAKAFTLANIDALKTNEAVVATSGDMPTIVIADKENMGPKAVALFSKIWRQVSIFPQLTVNTARTNFFDAKDAQPGKDAAELGRFLAHNTNIVPLSTLGGVPRSFDVLSRSDWYMSFNIAAVTEDGEVPERCVVDVSAAPGAAGAGPIASVFINDYLLGAKHLEATGQPERIDVAIPLYALSKTNVLRVTVQRQPVSDHCRETPQSFPAAVLPSSHIVLQKAPLSRDFVGMAGRFADGAQLIIPADWLKKATATLPTVFRLANAAGISPERTVLTLANAGTPVAPQQPFLALDTPIAGYTATVETSNGNLVIARDKTQKRILDISTLNKIGVAEVADTSPAMGIVYQSVGTGELAIQPSMRFLHGDLAIFGDGKILAELDMGNETRVDVATQKSEMSFWENDFFIKTTLFVAAAILIFFLLAVLVRRRSKKQ